MQDSRLEEGQVSSTSQLFLSKVLESVEKENSISALTFFFPSYGKQRICRYFYLTNHFDPEQKRPLDAEITINIIKGKLTQLVHY